ncbi:MAG TPA: Pr6Pr family membrane protein [Solirubrobacteraceae bacterium]|nr:Pr6Pr family membrane protein [Solirubrobacteraceae bacterium]
MPVAQPPAHPPRFGLPLTTARLAFGVLTLVAIVAQYTHRDHPSSFYTVNYLSFFTNLSNLLAAGLLLYGAYLGLRQHRPSGHHASPNRPSAPHASPNAPQASPNAPRASASPGGPPNERNDSSPYDLLRGAAVVYMTITGMVFTLLLSRSAQALPWANAVVHYIMPVVIVLDWLVTPPQMPLTRARAARWLIFPAVYFVYTLVRGAIVDWYPYPFLDVDAHGYARVFANGVGVLVAISAVGMAALLAVNRLGARINSRR